MGGRRGREDREGGEGGEGETKREGSDLPLSQASRKPFSMEGMKLLGMFMPTVWSVNSSLVNSSPVRG